MTVLSESAANAISWDQLVADVRSDSALGVERTVSYMDTLPSYAETDREAIREVVAANFEAVLDGLRDRRAPGGDDDVSRFDQRGELRARQGVAVSEMLAAWRVGLDALYRLAQDLCPASPGRDALLLEFLERTMAWVDFAMLSMTDGHRRGELRRARELQAAHANLLRRMTHGSASPGEIRAALTPLGLDPDAGYHVVRARLEPAVDVETLERFLEADGFGGRRRGLVGLVDGDVCGFVTELPRTAAPAAIGVSEPLHLAEMPSGFRRAGRALETALALGVRGAFDLTSLGVHPAVVADIDVRETLERRYISSILDLSGGEALLHTAERFLANDCSFELTARELGMHVNTVRQRIGRIEAATDSSLRATESLVELWWALAARRLH